MIYTLDTPFALDLIDHPESLDLTGADLLEEVIKKDLIRQIPKLIDALTDKEQIVIKERFGLSGQSPATLEEVGKKYGVTRERIRQIQNGALKKMRRSLLKLEDPRSPQLERDDNLIQLWMRQQVAFKFGRKG